MPASTAFACGDAVTVTRLMEVSVAMLVVTHDDELEASTPVAALPKFAGADPDPDPAGSGLTVIVMTWVFVWVSETKVTPPVGGKKPLVSLAAGNNPAVPLGFKEWLPVPWIL